MKKQVTIPHSLPSIVPVVHFARMHKKICLVEIYPNSYQIKGTARYSWLKDADIPHVRDLKEVSLLNLAHKDLKQKRKIARIAEDLEKRSKKQEPLWTFWSKDFVNPEIALAELIRVINRAVKNFPEPCYRNSLQKDLAEKVYSAKDKWLKQNKHNIVYHCVSAIFPYYYIDWDELHSMRNWTGEWQDSEDYLVRGENRFYLYLLNISGQEYNFHSKLKLFPDSPIDLSQHGSALPLSEPLIISDLQTYITLANYIIAKIDFNKLKPTI